MAAGSVGVGLKQVRPTAFPYLPGGSLGGGEDRGDVIAIHRAGRNSVGRCPVRNVIAAYRLAAVDEGLPLVVLADVEDGQVPQGGEIERFVEAALAGRTIAEETDDDAGSAEHALR